MPLGTKLLKRKFSKLLPLLNEKQRRIAAASEAKALGHGGISIVSKAMGISRPAIYRGLKDLRSKRVVPGVRRSGGGRKQLTEQQPRLKREIEKLVEPTTRGDPESLLKWSCKSTRKISVALQQKGFSVSHQSVAHLLRDEMGYSLRANVTTKEGKDHIDREQQFQHINAAAKRFLSNQDPVISVDTKKKELVGNYKNAGREWEQQGHPVEVSGHDFPDPKVNKAVPYGSYDVGDNKGWVNVGTTSDPAEFAVESIRYGWQEVGKKQYLRSRSLLICADSGGSNGYRSHLWKRELQRFSNETGLKISVCHFPPGTSKWNKIEHRLFSFITMNWRGKPLRSYRTIVNLIAATTTKTGLTVKVRLDKRKYKQGLKVSQQELERINLLKNDFHGEWNYTIAPNK